METRKFTQNKSECLPQVTREKQHRLHLWQYEFAHDPSITYSCNLLNIARMVTLKTEGSRLPEKPKTIFSLLAILGYSKR